MITFKSPEDLSKLSPDDPAFPIVKDLIKRLITNYIAEGYEYKPEDDGWICVVQQCDKDRVLSEIWSDWTLLDIPWEGISLVGDYYQGVFLANDQFGLVFLRVLRRVSSECPLTFSIPIGPFNITPR